MGVFGLFIGLVCRFWESVLGLLSVGVEVNLSMQMCDFPPLWCPGVVRCCHGLVMGSEVMFTCLSPECTVPELLGITPFIDKN